MVTKSEVVRMRGLVARIAATHTKGSAFPVEFRKEVMAYARARRAEGLKLQAIASEIGLSYWTLWEWFRVEARQRRPETDAPASIVPVHIVEARPAASRAGSLTIHGPFGLRIEGADVETIAALVRSLA